MAGRNIVQQRDALNHTAFRNLLERNHNIVSRVDARKRCVGHVRFSICLRCRRGMLQAYYAPAVCAPRSSGAVPSIAALGVFRGSPELRRASRRDRFASVSDHGGNAKPAGTAARLPENNQALRQSPYCAGPGHTQSSQLGPIQNGRSAAGASPGIFLRLGGSAAAALGTATATACGVRSVAKRTDTRVPTQCDGYL